LQFVAESVAKALDFTTTGTECRNVFFSRKDGLVHVSRYASEKWRGRQREREIRIGRVIVCA